MKDVRRNNLSVRNDMEAYTMKVIDIDQVCVILHISPQTGRNRISLGHPMPPSFKVGRRRLFLEEEVNRWLVGHAKAEVSQVVATPLPIKRGPGRPSKISRRRV